MKTSVTAFLTITTLLLSTDPAAAGGSGQPAWQAASPVISLVDEVQEIFPDRAPTPPVRLMEVHTPRNTRAGVHVLITGLRGTEAITFSETDPSGKPTPGIRWYRLIDVPVAENTGLDRNTEKYSGRINPHVIRRAPFRIYDPFHPVASPLVAESTAVALRVELPVDSLARPGTSLHRLRITIDGTVQTLDWRVVVHRATIPPLQRSTVSYINWLNIDNISSAHGLTKWSEPFWRMLARYAETMARGRQNAFWFIWGDYFTFDSSGNVTAFARERLERYIRIFLDAGMTTIHGAPMFGRRDWFHTDMLLSVQAADGREVDAVSERGKQMLAQMAERIIAMMRENGWEDRWVQGVFDEPEDPFVDRYRQLVSVLRGLKPDIQILEATMTTNVTGLVNIWCPQVQEYQARRVFFDGRKAAGDRVWVYTCLSPGGPWLNRLLDQERLRQVYIGWALAQFDLQGYLHWGGNFHTAKPFEELVRFHMEGQYLPAGDSHVLYPLPEGPLSSHRFEAHRIGMEDHDLLAQVKAHDPQQAVKIIGRVVQGFDRYVTDVGAYRTARKILLEAADLTPAERRVAAYIAAFNAGEAEMRSFIEQHWSAEALRSFPIGLHLDRYREMRGNMGTLRFHRLLSATDKAIATILHSEKEGWLEVSFGFDPSAHHAITRISIEQADDPDRPPVRRATSVNELISEVRAHLDSMSALDRFSGVVAIARGDSLLFSRAYGDLDRERKVPNRTDTRFNVGSINKVFTRIAILQLEARGKLSLSDTLGRFLPDYPNRDAARTVTVQHLLTMSSGIGDFFGDRYDAADREQIRSLRDYLPLFADKPLEFAPGTGRRYSNGGYVILGLIVEQASGMDYYDYVRQNVFAPAGMSGSDWFRRSSLPPDAARGYTTDEKLPNYSFLPGIGSSAGGGYCTATDLFRFVQALRKGVLRLPDSREGLGIAGGAPGLNADVEWFPATGFVVIVLCNLDPPVAVKTAQHISKMLPE